MQIRNLLIVTSLLFGSNALFAQDSDLTPWSYEINNNSKEYKGDIGSAFFTFENWKWAPGVTINRVHGQKKRGQIALNVNYGRMDADFEGKKFGAKLWDASLGYKLKLNRNPMARFVPYLT